MGPDDRQLDGGRRRHRYGHLIHARGPGRETWTNPGEIPNNGMDDDENGFVDDYYGYDFLYNDPDPHDENGHGTHTAGTIGAVGNNRSASSA